VSTHELEPIRQLREHLRGSLSQVRQRSTQSSAESKGFMNLRPFLASPTAARILGIVSVTLTQLFIQCIEVWRPAP
jgi:hypothetical protein